MSFVENPKITEPSCIRAVEAQLQGYAEAGTLSRLTDRLNVEHYDVVPCIDWDHAYDYCVSGDKSWTLMAKGDVKSQPRQDATATMAIVERFWAFDVSDVGTPIDPVVGGMWWTASDDGAEEINRPCRCKGMLSSYETSLTSNAVAKASEVLKEDQLGESLSAADRVPRCSTNRFDDDFRPVWKEAIPFGGPWQLYDHCSFHASTDIILDEFQPFGMVMHPTRVPRFCQGLAEIFGLAMWTETVVSQDGTDGTVGVVSADLIADALRPFAKGDDSEKQWFARVER
uniref:Uncharacterized protein n=1 Tax=Trichuris muris TaxID=70415 RepID=A0A5S6QHT6_TRIMR